MAREISNEQLFEFMTKMYSEMQGTKDEMQDGFKGLRQDNVRLENKMDENHKALYDGYKLVYEKLTRLEEKVDRHDVEIKIIKAVK